MSAMNTAARSQMWPLRANQTADREEHDAL